MYNIYVCITRVYFSIIEFLKFRRAKTEQLKCLLLIKKYICIIFDLIVEA